MGRFKERLAATGCKSYGEYLRSKAWIGFKRRYAAAGLSRECAVCGKTPISLHHHTYVRLGEEELSDVTPLCRGHHVLIHACLKARRWPVERTADAISSLLGGERTNPDSYLDGERRYPKPDWRMFRELSIAKKKRQKKAAHKATANHILKYGDPDFVRLAQELLALRKEGTKPTLDACMNMISCRDSGSILQCINRLKGVPAPAVTRSPVSHSPKKKKRKRKGPRKESARPAPEREPNLSDAQNLTDEERAMRAIAAGFRPSNTRT